ncbi:glycosyltransferase family 2 protein [Candidatus Chloroploca asiatica]|uniref:Glycosyltransferase 2-like domain-containing protein n=1 Tax=Candidatus Chloroploca asiatica TaxID=1506545 RepID=A0A2H3KH45_9CHLR|nr:glycosyltransferase family A protein [Candidatus Chloroploca asiatica]PDV97074.1 hypothetical protein A9Q02_19550 [Candidatus Chloroploca asiatica]
MAANNTISVIIPVYNGERFLAEALQSVLDQTLPPDEIIVVDDGSTDNSATIARSFGSPVRVLTQANLGPAAARNLGVAHTTGDLLAFLDADDLWLPNKLARQLHVLQDDPTCEAVLGGMENFISPELDEYQHQMLARSANQGGTHHVGTLLIRRAAFQRIGPFDERWRHGEFIEWWARAMQFHLSYVALPDLVLRRRLHAHNLTRREQDGRREYLGMLRELIAQRRTLAKQAEEPSG